MKNQIKPREVVLNTLMQFESSKFFLKNILSSKSKNWSHSEFNWISQCSFGVLQYYHSLEYPLKQFVSKWPKEKELKWILFMGAYELLKLDNTKPYATIHELVELCKKRGYFRQSGFINAILRKISSMEKINSNFTPPTHPQALSQYYSQPQWLIEEWLKLWSMETVLEILKYNNEDHGFWIRVDLYKRPQFTPKDIPEFPVESESFSPQFPYMYTKHINSELFEHPLFVEGILSIQNPISWEVGKLFGNLTENRFLDFCAAPGGKTRIMQQKQGERLLAVCMDLEFGRLNLVKRVTSPKNTLYIQGDGRCPPIKKKFPFIWLDAPCSNSGVIRQKPELRFQLQTSESIESLAKIQLELLEQATSLLSPGGVLVFSVCSILPQEGPAVIENFLKSNPKFKCTPASEYIHPSLVYKNYLLCPPGLHKYDGFFAARIEHQV